MPKRVASSILSQACLAQSGFHCPLHVLFRDMMSSGLPRSRIHRELICGKHILPQEIRSRVFVFLVQRVWQIDFAITTFQIVFVQLLHGFYLYLEGCRKRTWQHCQPVFFTFLPREIISKPVLDIPLAPTRLQVFFSLRCFRLIEATFPIDKLEWPTSFRRRNQAVTMILHSLL